MKQILQLTLMLALTLASTSAAASPMTLKQVINSVIAHDPGLRISRLDTAIAAADRQRLDGLLDPRTTASLSASREQAPIASDFQARTTRRAGIAAGISKPMLNGGTLAADLNFNRTGQDFNSPFAAQLAKFNPSYTNQLNVSYRHPLLRGADRPDYNQAITANGADTRAALQQQQSLAHTLALQAMNAYFQLASDDINIDIAEQAVIRASRLLTYQHKRETFGLIERADRLQAEALLAARKTDRQQALALRAGDLSLLNRLMQRQPDMPLSISLNRTTLPPTSAFEELVKQAIKQRPELQAIDARLKAADARLLVATDGDQSQLDLVAQLGTRSLNGSPGKSASQSLSIHDNFVSLSLEYADVWGRNSSRAAIRKAELARQRLIAERQQTIALISDQLASASTALIHGKTTLSLAEKQALAEGRQFNAEMQRYREGRSDTATIVQFEGDLRSAQLRAKLQRLSLQLAAGQLAWARGDLLQPRTDTVEGDTAWSN